MPLYITLEKKGETWELCVFHDRLVYSDPCEFMRISVWLWEREIKLKFFMFTHEYDGYRCSGLTDDQAFEVRLFWDAKIVDKE